MSVKRHVLDEIMAFWMEDIRRPGNFRARSDIQPALEMEKMRIAQIAPLTEAVPPKLYGGTERVVSFVTEELVALGHDVTLFASGDSVTAARLEPMCPRALRLDPGVRDPLAPHL